MAAREKATHSRRTARNPDRDVSRDRERLRFLTGHLDVCIWETDADLRIGFFEGTLPSVSIAANDSALGRSLLELHEKVEHRSADESARQLARLDARAPFSDYEVMQRRPDGTTIHLRASGQPMHGPGGDFIGYRGTIGDVTAEVQARREVMRSGAAQERELLQEAIEVLEDGFAVYDAQDRLAIFNASYRAIYGNTVRRGASFSELYADVVRKNLVVNRTDHAAVWKGRRMARDPGKLPPLEQNLSDGRWFRVTSARMRNGGSAELRADITALKVREQVLQAIMDSVADGIILFALDGTVREANEAARRIFGYAAHEIAGSDVLGLLALEEQSEGARVLRGRLASRLPVDTAGTALPATGCRRNGTPVPIEVSVSTTTLGIERICIMSVHDLSQRRILESQLAHADRLRTMGEMAAHLAHDLKQPLSVISMAAELAAIRIEDGHPFDPAFTLEKLQTVCRQAEHVGKLIDHIRSFARRGEEAPRAIDAGTVLEDALRMFRKEFEIQGIDLVVDRTPEAATTWGTPIRFGQAIVNLLSNARDAVLARAAAEPGAPQEIRVELARGNGTVSLSISDTGGGIPPDVADRVFEPFVTTKEAGKGTGLGLSIVHSIVDSMSGTVRAENVGEGSRFVITVPSATTPV